MDGSNSNWKKLLLNWINSSKLLDRSSYNIEQTDINEFYTKLRQKMVAFPYTQEDLLLFLKEQYPNIEFHKDDENQLSSSDYMYVYSLLLHFCCVKYSDEYFQIICQNLHNIYQKSIAIFFEEILSVEKLDKTILRNVISMATPKTLPSRLESPTRISKPKISPPTPKTHMLDERTKEMQTLKAQLDNEKYEKSCIELLLKENEDKTLHLIKDQKKFVTEIKELKAELSTKSCCTDDCSATNNISEEQKTKKQLRKQICDKEEELLNLKENYNLIVEEKKLLHLKLKDAEKYISTCMENINETDNKLFELNAELEEKVIYINQLTDSKNELLQYINEVKNSSSYHGHDLNTSAECLDTSFLPHTPNSSGSLGSPENLGCSVIDKQLRENQIENNQLRIEIDKFKSDNKKLSGHLCTLLKKYSDSFDICNENLITNKDDDFTKNFMIFENYLGKLIQQYSIVKTNLSQSVDENNSLKSQIIDLGKKIFTLGTQISDYDKKVDDLKKTKIIIESENQTFKRNCESYNLQIEKLIDDNLNVTKELNNLNEQYKISINEKNQLNDDFTLKIFKLTENVTEKCKQIDEFDKENIKLLKTNESLQLNINELHKNNNNMENITKKLKQEKDQINEELSKLQNMLKRSTDAEEKLNNERLIMLKKHDEHLQIIDKFRSKLNKFEINISSQETDIQSYGDNKLQSHTEYLNDNAEFIKEIEDKFMKLKNNFELKHQEIITLQTELGEKTAQINKLNSEIEILHSKDLTSENSQKILKIQVDSLNNEITENKKLITELQQQLNIAIETFEHLKTDKNKELFDCKNSIDKHLDNEKCLKQKNDDLIEQCGEYRDKFTLTTRSLKENQAEMESLEDKLKEKIIQSTDLNKKIEILTSNNKKLEFDIEKMKSTYDQNISELNKKIEEMIVEKDIINKEYISLKEYNNVCENKIKSFELQIIKLYKDIEKFEMEKNKLSIDYDEISNVVETIASEKLSVEAYMENLQKEIAEKSDCLINTTKLFDNELINIITEIENNVDNLKQSKEITNMLQVNIKIDTPLEKLKNTINILLNVNSELLQKNDNFEKIILNLKNDLNVQNNEQNEINEKLLISSNDNEALNTKLLILTEQINEMMKKIQTVTDNCTLFKQEQFSLLDKLSLQQKELENMKSDKNCLIDEKNILNNKYEEIVNEYDMKKKEFYNKCTEFDNILDEKNTQICMIEDDKLKLTNTIKELTDKLNEKLKQYENEKIESENIYGTLKYNNNLSLEKYTSKEKECNLLSEEMRALAAHSFCLEDNLTKTKKSLEEYEKIKEKYDDLNVSRISLKNTNENQLRELNETKKLLIEEQSKYEKVICELKKQSQDFEEQITKYINEINLLKKNIKILTENLNQIEDEKIVFREENRNLKEQLELEMIKTEVNQKKIKELTNNISSLEVQLNNLNDETETIKNEKDLEYLKLEKKYSNLNIEFNKMNECQLKSEENSLELNKRLEKISIRLGEYQEKYANFETENNSLKKYFESNKNSLDNLQKEYSKLTIQYTNLQKEHSRIAKSEESIKLKLNEMENNNEQIKLELDKALAAELNGRDNLQKITIIKKDDDEKIKKLSTTLGELTHINQSIKQEMEYLEQKNVQLTLEIGSLNQLIRSIEDLKKTAETENITITKNMIEIKNKNENLLCIIEQHQTELNQLREENSKLNDVNSKLSLQLQIIKQEYETNETELNNIKLNNETGLNNIKSINEIELNNLKSTIKQLQIEKENSLKESFLSLALLKNLESQQTAKDDKIVKLKEILNEKDKCILQLNEEINLIKLELNNNDDLKKKMIEFDELNILYEQQREKTEKLKRDTSIFQAKLTKQRAMAEEREQEWLDEKNHLIEINKTSEERIKNNRLELEGKLEKMKAKMKTLYNEEVAKLKNKHEREIFDFQAEIQVLKGQNDKYDMHMKKLSHRVVTLNEKICEYERDNRFMELKLKEYENIKTTSLRRQPPQQHQQQLSSYPQHSQLPVNSHKMLSTANLKMEDEEGEIFNNTYLTDLKEGRISEFGIRDSISVKELQYRNSIAAPHLRSTYLAQYKEHNLPEEDIKDGNGPINLDDSLSSLLNTDKRKKVAGTTSYKRPGPPTPSKTAGRLSFGGNNELHSTILKESNVNDVSTIRKTPAKFKLFSSRAPKDEQIQHHNRRSSIKRKSLLMKPLYGTLTSTPRKSKVHFDQRRQLEIILNQSQSDSQTDTEKLSEIIKMNTRNDNNIINDPTIVLNHIDKEIPRKFTKWRNSKNIYSTESGTSDSNSPYVTDEPTCIQQKSSNKHKERRFSIINRRNIYGRSKVPSKILRDQIKLKAKSERCKNFNKFRQSLSEVHFRKSILNQPNTNLKNIECDNNDELNLINNNDTFQNDLTKTNIIFEDDCLQSDLMNFEKLIQKKESKAPFEITEINLVSSLSANSATNSTSIASNSKTLYASSVIYNRKLPKVSKTAVLRKSSIYLKNGNESLILITNQTITLLDIIKMWKQMNTSVKLFFSFCISILIIIFPFILYIIWLS